MFKFINKIQKECIKNEGCGNCCYYQVCEDITKLISDVCCGMEIPCLPSLWSNEEKDIIAIVLSLMLNEEQ